MDMPQKTEAELGAERVRQHLQSRGNPIRGLTPEKLVSYLDAFRLGYLRQAANAWQFIKERDDVVLPVSEKRELAVSLLNYEILKEDDSPEASRHQAALEAFYSNLTATHVFEQNQCGGVAMLLKQMMHAQGHRYAVHEIVWDPSGKDLTAKFIFTPLDFFENTTGRLRFLGTDYALEGTPMADGEWLVTVGAGLMHATSIAYLFKVLPLKDWLIFCERAGIPGLHGQTDARKGTPEYAEFRDALASFGVEWSLITSTSAKLTPIDLKAGGEPPHPTLVDRMDRAISRIWRGADLGTMSKDGQAVGSQPQEDETSILEIADAMLLSETLQRQVDRFVIGYRFGETPKAYFQLQPRKRVNVRQELEVDRQLVSMGVPMAISDLQQRYNRPAPKSGEDIATKPAAAVVDSAPFANEAPGAVRTEAMRSLAQARAAQLKPLRDRVAQVAYAEPEQVSGLLRRLRDDTPALFASAAADPAMALAMEEALLAQAQEGANDQAQSIAS